MMREFEKMIKGNKIILVVAINEILMKALFIHNGIFVDCAYKQNIGTIYKGSNNESNTKFRFKERFKMNDGAFWCDNSSLCMEAI